SLELEFQIALERLLYVLANQKFPQVLQIGQAFQKEDALDQSIRMLHLIDRFLVRVLAELVHSPVVEHARVQEVLIDGRELVLQHGLQRAHDVGVALHPGHSLRLEETMVDEATSGSNKKGVIQGGYT